MIEEARTQAPSAPGAARLTSLDLLRAVAILLVLGRHANVSVEGWAPALAVGMRAWMRGGWIGVDLFFVLSGFLVSGLLFREHQQAGSVHIGRFLIRRGLKIYPAFYLFLAVTAVHTVARKGPGAVPLPSLLSEVFFVSNYGPSLVAHSWSLAVEEHFYILCALLILRLSRRSGRDPYRSIPGIFAVVAVACLAARISAAAVAGGYSFRANQIPTHLRIDGLMFGVCLAYLYHFRRGLLVATIGRWRGRAALLGLLLLAPAFVFEVHETPLLYTAGLTTLYLGSGLLLLALLLGGPITAAPLRLLARMGVYSYSIYLWHVTVRSLWEHALPALHVHSSQISVALYVPSSVACGIVMAKLVEMRVLRLRDRLFPSALAGGSRR